MSAMDSESSQRTSHETGPAQHFVPQQMIRRFGDARNQLRILHKSTLQISRRLVGPKGVLWKEDYYKDMVGDLDAEWLTPIEQRFRKYYPKLADQPWSTAKASRDESEAFVDWTLSQLCRTEWLPRMMAVLASQHVLFKETIKGEVLVTLANRMRRPFFEQIKEIYTLPGWKWLCFNITCDENLILTDHPVCTIGKVIFVPLSKKRIIFGGCEADLERIRGLSVLHMNCHSASFAAECIHAADRATLERVASELRGEGTIQDPGWLENARKPLFGQMDRAELGSSDGTDVFYQMRALYS
jgi:hypothetical protein